MRSSSTIWTALSPLLLLLILALTSTTTVAAQSDICHACIRKAITTVPDCASLTPASLDTLDKIIIGSADDATDKYKTSDPAGLKCLTALMWDSVQYKGKLWGGCLDPRTACPWAEMMQWLEIIPKVASIYGAGAPPGSSVLTSFQAIRNQHTTPSLLLLASRILENTL
ncbi:hypothetical protein BGX30_012138 [Mortierella sp. GBA39]|nr:hypothetical protein BGX30_012138 [Mortierella sp. GBA39]